MSLALRMYTTDGEPAVPYIVKYRNTIAEAAHGDELADAIVVQLDTENLEVPQQVLGRKRDFWTTSIKRGRVVYTNHDLASRYVDTAEGIVYMSFLTSSLTQKPIWKALRVLVVEDGERETSDCFGYITESLIAPILQGDRRYRQKRRDTGFSARCINRRTQVAQFRLVIPNMQLAKGVVMVRDLPDKIDLVLPLSCFKGRTPTTGKHTWPSWFGVREWARPLATRVSYQVLQWFSNDSIADDVVPSAVIDAAHYSKCVNYSHSARNFLGLKEGEEPRTGLERILIADKYGLLMRHPVIARKIRWHMRRRWLDTALGGGIYASSAMSIPAEDLEVNEVQTPHAPMGDILMWRYPVTNGDSIKVVRNVGGGIYGTIAMTTELAGLMQGDFDGDYFCFSDTLHSMIRECGNRQHFNETIGLHKVRGSTPLDKRTNVIERAIASAAQIGQVSNMITRGISTDMEMETLVFLGQALQAAVDGIKWETDIDWDRVAEIRKELPRIDWLTARTNKAAWNEYALKSGSSGVIASLWNAVQRWFKPISTDTLPPSDYTSLVPKVRNAPLEEMVRYMMIHLYSGPIAALAQMQGLNDDERTSRLAEICGIWRDWCEGQPITIGDKGYDGLVPEIRASVFAITWHMDCARGTSAAMVGFPDKVVDMLETVVPETIMVSKKNNAVLLQDGRLIQQLVAEEMGYEIAKGWGLGAA